MHCLDIYKLPGGVHEMSEAHCTLEVKYPVFLLGAKSPGGFYATILARDGQWFPLFTTIELAERYSAQDGRGYVHVEVDKEALVFLLRTHTQFRGCIFNPTCDHQMHLYLDRRDFI
jgi:hypothetical protein